MADERYLGGLDRLRALVDTWTGAERPAGTSRARRGDRAFTAARVEADGRSGRGAARVSRSARSRPHDDRRRRARVGGDHGARRPHRRLPTARSGGDRNRDRAVRRPSPLAGHADLRGRDDTRAACESSTRASARFAELDEVQILGLVEGEWPERQRRNVFYPRSLVAQLEPSRPERVALDEERDHVRSARAMFRDLIGLALTRTRLSTFALESEAVVEPSSFIDDVTSFGMPTERAAPHDDARVFGYEVLADDPVATGSPWAVARAGQAAAGPAAIRR